MRHVLALLVAVLAGQAAASQTYQWVGGASGSWQTPTNWSPQGVPGSGATVTFRTTTNVTLAADVSVAGVDAYGERGPTGPGETPVPSPLVTISSAAHRFVSLGSASAADGTLTILARVDTCGRVDATGSASNRRKGDVSLQNVGGVGEVNARGSVALNGDALRVGNVAAYGGPALISGTVLRVGNVTSALSQREGAGNVVVTSAPVPGATVFGDLAFPDERGTIDLRIADIVIASISSSA